MLNVLFVVIPSRYASLAFGKAGAAPASIIGQIFHPIAFYRTNLKQNCPESGRVHRISCARFRAMMEGEVNAKWTQRPFQWWEMEYLPLLKKLKVRAPLVKKDEVLDFWKKYHGEVTKMLSEINDLEEQLDARVYAIYKLDTDQIAIVESYFSAIGSADNDEAA